MIVPLTLKKPRSQVHTLIRSKRKNRSLTETRDELRLTALEGSRDLVADWEKKGLYGPICHDRDALA